MDTCDVLIVGGGPAGSSCAWRLSQAGYDVAVFDKARFPRDKVCAGWITPAVIDELRLDLADYRSGQTLQPITGFRTSLRSGRELLTEFGRPVSYGIRRCEFDHYLLQRSGARLILGEPLQNLRREGNRWIVNEQISAPLVVGAGGHFCPVARQTTTDRAVDETVVLAQEIEFELTPDQSQRCPVAAEIPELFFCDDLRGYAWCVRKQNFLNIGLGREGEKGLSSQVEDFARLLRERGRIPHDTPRRFHGHAYKLYLGRTRQLQTDRVLLIGDAAGLAYPQSGEGIRPAIESGLLAAETIRDSSGRYDSRLSDRLHEKLVSRLGIRGKVVSRTGGTIRSCRNFVARRLMASRWFVRSVLIERWFLHAHQPPLTLPELQSGPRHVAACV